MGLREGSRRQNRIERKRKEKEERGNGGWEEGNERAGERETGR